MFDPFMTSHLGSGPDAPITQAAWVMGCDVIRRSNNVIVYVLSSETIYILLPYLNIADLYKTHIYRSSSYKYTEIK